MKVIKPQLLSLGFRPFLWDNKPRLTLTAMVGFALGGSRSQFMSESKLWSILGEATGGFFDEGLPKTRGEVLVFGSGFAPRAAPVTAAEIRVAIATVDKRLAVFGDRYWHGASFSDPIPFTEMPLGWRGSFGGEGSKINPAGKGLTALPDKNGIARVPLPNLENPLRLVRSPNDRPAPANLGPIDPTWAPRATKAGSYGPGYLEKHFPGFPPDIQPEFFQMASPDQWLKGFFVGDEPYRLENLHPTRPAISGTLPAVRSRCFVRGQPSRDFDEVPMRLETLIFLPGDELGVLVFRGTTPVTELDGADLGFVLAAFEEMETRRSTEHYRAAFESRLDKDQSPLLALKEDDLTPSFAVNTDLVEMMKAANAKADAGMKAQVGRIEHRVRAEMVAAGLPEAEIESRLAASRAQLPILPDMGDPQSVAVFLKAMEQRQVEAEKQREQSELELKEKMVEVGKDPEETRGSGPPAKTAEQTLASLLESRASIVAMGMPVPPELEMMLKDPKLKERLETADRAAWDSYRDTAHFQPPPPAASEETSASRRKAALNACSDGGVLDEWNLTGVDLSGTSFERASLKNAFLAGANLAQSNLSGADLSGALLAHANLKDALLNGIKGGKANFGAALLEETHLENANLQGADFTRTKINSASLKGTRLASVTLLETEFGRVDFDSADLFQVSFLKCDLSRCRFCGANLKKSDFIEVCVNGVPFARADLELASWVTVSADGCDFQGAHLAKWQAVMGCSFKRANLKGANLEGATLRGADFEGADFTGANLTNTDLSECNLRGAILADVQAKNAMFIRADLTGACARRGNFMMAMLSKAIMRGANFSSANMHGADLGGIRLDERTSLHGALMDRALTYPVATET